MRRIGTGAVIVYGPMACGKTSHSAFLLKYFNVKKIVDDWNPRHHDLIPGALHLTNVGRIAIATQPCPVVAYQELSIPKARKRAPGNAFIPASGQRKYQR